MKEQELLKKGLDIIEKIFKHFTRHDLDIAKEILEYKEEVNTHLSAEKPIEPAHEEKTTPPVPDTTKGKSDDVVPEIKPKEDVTKKTVGNDDKFPWE